VQSYSAYIPIEYWEYLNFREESLDDFSNGAEQPIPSLDGETQIDITIEGSVQEAPVEGETITTIEAPGPVQGAGAPAPGEIRVTSTIDVTVTDANAENHDVRDKDVQDKS
jgi:hypothetical protein